MKRQQIALAMQTCRGSMAKGSEQVRALAGEGGLQLNKFWRTRQFLG